MDGSLPGSSVRGFPGQECWSGLHAIFLTQGLNLCLLHWPADSLLLSHQAASAAKLLQLCLIVCDPIDGSLPGSTILGFSRQEHWSVLPFSSLMHESEK